MRTGILKEQIKEYYKHLNVENERINMNGNSYQKIKNWRIINAALYGLNEFEFIGESVKKIFSIGANFMASTETTVVAIGDYEKFINYFNIVKAKCEAIIDMNNSIDDIDEENYLYIKLPNNLKELEKLNEIIKGLDIIFNQCPILRNTYNTVDFVRVDVGSSWLVLSVILGSAPIVGKTLNWIADFIKKCNEIRIQNRNIRKMDLEYLISKAEFDEKESQKFVQKIQKGIEKDLEEKYIQEFKDINIPIEGEILPEDKLKIVHCMSKMIDLLEMGVELYPSEKVSTEVKEAFPKKEEWKRLTSEIKLLKDK